MGRGARLLDRYVTGEFTRLFLLFVIGAPVLFVIGDVTDNLDRYLDRGLTFGQVALSYVYQLPLFVLYSFPVAALIATIFTVSGMTRHHEVAAAKAGGVSFYRMMAPLPLLGILLTGAALGLSELVPVANQRRAEVLGERQDLRGGRTDFVYRGDNGYVYAIRQLDAARGRLSNIAVEREGNPPDVPGTHITARSGAWTASGGWVFENGYMRILGAPGEERTFRFDAMRHATFTETPEELLAEPKEPEEMRYAELGRFIEILERSGDRPLKLMVEQAEKIALPVATLIIILFAAPLATSSRRGGAAYGVGISLAITVVYLMLFKVSGAAGASGAIPPVLAAWLPNGIFFLAALGLIFRVRT